MINIDALEPISDSELFERDMLAILPPPPSPPDRISWMQTLLIATGEGSILACGRSPHNPRVRYRRMHVSTKVYQWAFGVVEQVAPASMIQEIMRLDEEFHWKRFLELLPDSSIEKLIARLEQLKEQQTPEDIKAWRAFWDKEQQELNQRYGFK